MVKTYKKSDISVGPVEVKETDIIIAAIKMSDGGACLMEYDFQKKDWFPVKPNTFDYADLMEGTFISLDEITHR